MRKRNKPHSSVQEYLTNPIYEPLPLYQTEDGSKSTDISKAVKTSLGIPIQVGYSETECVAVPFKELHLSYNPNNPSARQIALEARASMNNAVESTIYSDKFEAHQYAHNSIKAFEEKYNTLITKQNEQKQ